MSSKAYVLSKDDLDIIKRFLDQSRNDRLNAQSRPGTAGSDIDVQEQQGPEMYMVLAPSDGIPEVTLGMMGQPDVPGSADCKVYRVATISGDDKLCKVSDDWVITVFNATPNKLKGYVAAWRDKFGTWWGLPMPDPLKTIPVVCSWSCDGTTGEATVTTMYATLPLSDWESNPPTGTGSADQIEDCGGGTG
jgi:hypothetical protein